MKPNFQNIIVLSMTITLSQPAFPQSEKFGKLIYTVPPGWKLSKYQDGARISPADLPAGEYLAIQVMKPVDFTGNMEQALEKSYDETCAALQVTKMHEVSGGISVVPEEFR
jgi:acyl transferase domain-containing protein